MLVDRQVGLEYGQTLLGPSPYDETREEKISLTSSEDELCWSKTENGLFSTNLAWESIRGRGLNSFLFKHPWHARRPIKISVFLWKMMKKALPVDILLQKKKVFI